MGLDSTPTRTRTTKLLLGPLSIARGQKVSIRVYATSRKLKRLVKKLCPFPNSEFRFYACISVKNLENLNGTDQSCRSIISMLKMSYLLKLILN